MPVERPSFSDINTRLSTIIEDLNDRGSVDGGDNIEPQPRNRLSYHEFYFRSRSRSCTSPELDLTTCRETKVWWYIVHVLVCTVCVYILYFLTRDGWLWPVYRHAIHIYSGSGGRSPCRNKRQMRRHPLVLRFALSCCRVAEGRLPVPPICGLWKFSSS